MLTIAESPLWTNTPYEAEVLLLKKLLAYAVASPLKKVYQFVPIIGSE